MVAKNSLNFLVNNTNSSSFHIFLGVYVLYGKRNIAKVRNRKKRDRGRYETVRQAGNRIINIIESRVPLEVAAKMLENRWELGLDLRELKKAIEERDILVVGMFKNSISLYEVIRDIKDNRVVMADVDGEMSVCVIPVENNRAFRDLLRGYSMVSKLMAYQWTDLFMK